MAKLSFNFGANKKPNKAAKTKKSGGKKRGSGTKNNNAWRSYAGVSNAPIPP